MYSHEIAWVEKSGLVVHVLTLKAPEKKASENVFCLNRLLLIFANK